MPGGLPLSCHSARSGRCAPYLAASPAAALARDRGHSGLGRRPGGLRGWAATCCGSGLLLAGLLAGCASPSGFSLFGGLGTENAVAETDTCGAPEACAAELKRLVSEPRRDWIGRPQSADAYADGTRLFAYRALRKKLSCGELKIALQDTTAAATLLQTPRYERARTLTTAVGHELKIEQDKRCAPRR